MEIDENLINNNNDNNSWKGKSFENNLSFFKTKNIEKQKS